MEPYTAYGFVFPIQTLKVNQNNGNFTTGIPNIIHLDFTIQHIPRVFDAIFYFFPLKQKYQTCFIDLDIKNIQISMGDFGAYRWKKSTGA
jgi:hypothetical protein